MEVAVLEQNNAANEGQFDENVKDQKRAMEEELSDEKEPSSDDGGITLNMKMPTVMYAKIPKVFTSDTNLGEYSVAWKNALQIITQMIYKSQ